MTEIKVIPPDGTLEDGSDVYEDIKYLVANYHPGLADAVIYVAYRFGWKRDAEGHMCYGKMKKAGPIEKALVGKPIDFIMLLNGEKFPSMTEKIKRALLDHLLCYGDETLDKNGCHESYRIASPDLEGFAANVRRHGLWHEELESMFDAMTGKDKPSLFSEVDAKEAEVEFAYDKMQWLSREFAGEGVERTPGEIVGILSRLIVNFRGDFPAVCEGKSDQQVWLMIAQASFKGK